MRVLVTGAAGLLGAAIQREFQHEADRGYSVVALDRPALDLTDEAAVAAVVAEVAPSAIVNCAAYNDVDGAERDPGRALRVNAFGVQALARAARAADAALVHYSTDFVFDGEASEPYAEEDSPNPRGVYAASKLLGDWFALELPRGYVLRVESLFGAPGGQGSRRGSLGTIVEGIRRGEEVPVFVDRTVSPSYTDDIAVATRALLERGIPAGLYHCVNSGTATWAEIAETAARALGAPLRMRPITLDTANLAARRPRYSALSNARLASAGIVMPHWRDALSRYLGHAS
jgi:dTDP-4-dehydrorhamnose reductase